LDTYESRRRARLIMGSLIAVCVLLTAWIAYRVFRHDPSDAVPSADDLATAPATSPEPRPPLDHEARFMFNRAREDAKDGRTDQAVAMLKRVISVYKGTPTAAEARAALDRPNQNLPLFP